MILQVTGHPVIHRVTHEEAVLSLIIDLMIRVSCGVDTLALVEDELIIAEDMRNILEMMGYSVIDIAMDAEEAVACLSKEKPDLALLDINLGGKKDGVQLAQVTKRWAGIGKELFTTADNYVVSIDPTLSDKNETRLLILAAALCIDKVLKE